MIDCAGYFLYSSDNYLKAVVPAVEQVFVMVA